MGMIYSLAIVCSSKEDISMGTKLTPDQDPDEVLEAVRMELLIRFNGVTEDRLEYQAKILNALAQATNAYINVITQQRKISRRNNE